MTIEVIPELGVDIPDDIGYLDLKERADAACRTAQLLEEHGVDIDEMDDFQKEFVATITQSYAEDPKKASKALSDTRMSSVSPAAMVQVSHTLNAFGQLVAEDSARIRNMVTNKLILLSEDEDTKTQLRALELLGKISDVGLFTEKREITINHQTSEELRERLRSKLDKLVNGDPIEEAEFTEVVEEQ